MRQYKLILTVTALPLLVMVAGCGLMDEPKAKNAPFGLITTPASYYSTSKARYLGDKYKANLDRLVERIVSNPKTASLQFANNIASVGGIGFFTHSAATTPDERYLEVVLAAPETFEASGEYSGKLNQLFASYGIELLSILASDADIYQEKDVSGYGLNLSWRKVVREPSGPRVSLERAVAYFSKQKVRAFLRQEVSQNDLLEVAVIFAVEEDGPMRLVTYRPMEPKPDFRAPIQEQTLASRSVETKAETKPSTPALPVSQTVQAAQVEKKAGGSQNRPSALIEKTSPNADEAVAVEKLEQVEISSSLREEMGASKVTADKRASETVRASDVAEKSAVELVPVTGKVNQITIPPVEFTPPRVETIPDVPPSLAETGQVVADVVPKVNVPGEQVTADEFGAQSESLVDKTGKVGKPKVKPGAEESLSQAPSANSAVSNTGTVKPDTVTSAGEKKLEPLVAAPKVETKAREATIQNEAVAEKKPQFVSRPELIKEKQPAGTPSPVATAGVKAPTTIQAAEEPAPAAQTPALDKPASERAGMKTLQGAPAPMQPAPAATGKVSEKPTNEQIALLTKRPEEVIQEKKSLPRPTPKALEGYIVQLSFSQRDEAQRWAEKLASQGYAVSMTETGDSAFRVRIGNFAVRSEAERRLKTLGQEGLKGIVLNLPQAYRPDSGRAAEATADAISLTP